MDRNLEILKGWDAPRVLALLTKMGPEKAEAYLAGKLALRWEGEPLHPLFDRHARRIPKDLQAAVCDANRDFRLDKPKLKKEADCADRILCLHGCLGVDTGITAEYFQRESERLLDIVRNNAQTVNLAKKGVCLPVVLPKLTTDDIGETLEQYLEAVGKSYTETFPKQEFRNYRRGSLAGKVSVVDGSRHDRLIAKMKQGPVIGLHFPNALQGFSIKASREQMATLPAGFILSGLDTAIALAMYPDILARDYQTPGLDLAALSWRSAVFSLHFKAFGGDAAFGFAGLLAFARGNSSAGLLFIG